MSICTSFNGEFWQTMYTSLSTNLQIMMYLDHGSGEKLYILRFGDITAHFSSRDESDAQAKKWLVERSS